MSAKQAVKDIMVLRYEHFGPFSVVELPQLPFSRYESIRLTDERALYRLRNGQSEVEKDGTPLWLPFNSCNQMSILCWISFLKLD